ncbi:MAG: 50S ribosomal protein L11 methyltransferase [Lachnospiraceae bacterium]|nr:50S ribosomal protein L11 methyltransferase [Lachnospiraceae bacterium]
MKWESFTIETKAEAEDILSATLAGLGIEGVEIRDHVPLTKEEAHGMFIDTGDDEGKSLMPPLPEDDRAQVIFYLDPEKDDIPAMLRKVQAALEELKLCSDIGSAAITQSETEDKDWINNWKKYWHTFTIGKLVIKPTWEDVPEELSGRPVLSMDPGTAFGTGAHETTRMVIRELQEAVKGGEQILDVGCGSGILSLAALLFGAGHAVGTDLDPNARTAFMENADVNHFPPESYDIVLGDIVTDKKAADAVGYGRYDIVCANILHDVLIPMSAVIDRHMKDGGLLFTSGIIEAKETDVRNAIEANPHLKVLETYHDGEWVSITAKKV